MNIPTHWDDLATIKLFSPNSVVSVVTLEVLTVVQLSAAIYNTFMPLEIPGAHFDCAGSQNLGVRGGRLSRLATALSVFWRSKVDLSRQAQEIRAVREADFVAGTALWIWW